MNVASKFALAAEQMIGVPFRLHGRDVQTGVDCIGLVATALAAIGRTPPPLPRYTMRNLDLARFMQLLPLAGFGLARSEQGVGDLLLLRPSPAQFHLAIVSPTGALIHAHAGLGRVVASPPPLAWPQLARWQLTSDPR